MWVYIIPKTYTRNPSFLSSLSPHPHPSFSFAFPSPIPSCDAIITDIQIYKTKIHRAQPNMQREHKAIYINAIVSILLPIRVPRSQPIHYSCINISTLKNHIIRQDPNSSSHFQTPSSKAHAHPHSSALFPFSSHSHRSHHSQHHQHQLVPSRPHLLQKKP